MTDLERLWEAYRKAKARPREREGMTVPMPERFADALIAALEQELKGKEAVAKIAVNDVKMMRDRAEQTEAENSVVATAVLELCRKHGCEDLDELESRFDEGMERLMQAEAALAGFLGPDGMAPLERENERLTTVMHSFIGDVAYWEDRIAQGMTTDEVLAEINWTRREEP